VPDPTREVPDQADAADPRSGRIWLNFILAFWPKRRRRKLISISMYFKSNRKEQSFRITQFKIITKEPNCDKHDDDVIVFNGLQITD